MVHDWVDPTQVAAFEARGLVTSTFRRLAVERQQAVVGAILQEAFERGPARLRLKEAAAAAGVSVGSLYLYFGNRQGVLDFAVELVAEVLAGQLRGFIPDLVSLPLHQALQAWVSGGTEWSQGLAPVMKYFARAAYEGDPGLGERLVHPVAAAMYEAITAILAAAQQRGEVGADLDLAAAAGAVHAGLAAVADAALVPHLAGYLLPGAPDVSPEQTMAATIDLLCRGLS